MKISRPYWRFPLATVLLAIAGCSSTDKLKVPDPSTDPTKASSLYSIPSWHEPLQRFTDPANAEESSQAVKAFAEVTDKSTGLPAIIGANLEAERTWNTTINSVATRSGEVERALSIVNAETKWSEIRERVYEIMSVAVPSPNQPREGIAKRVDVRLNQLAVLREVLGTWAAYEAKQIEKAQKALKVSKGYLDNAKNLKLPEIIWRSFNPSTDSEQTLDYNLRDLMPNDVLIESITVASTNPNDATKFTHEIKKDGEIDSILSVKIQPSFAGPADVKVEIKYKVGAAGPQKTATTTVRYFSDPAELAWTRFAGAIVDASREWLKMREVGAKETKKLEGGAVEGSFVEKMLLVTDKAIEKQEARLFLDSKLGTPGSADSPRKAFRDLLIDAFSDSLTEARQKRNEGEGDANEKDEKRRQNLHEAFQSMISEDDPRVAIDQISRRGTDPVAVYSMVAALRGGLNAKEEALLNSYIAHLKTYVEAADTDPAGPKAASVRLARRPEPVTGPSFAELALRAEQLNAAASAGSTQPSPLDDVDVGNEYDGGFTKRLLSAVETIKTSTKARFSSDLKADAKSSPAVDLAVIKSQQMWIASQQSNATTRTSAVASAAAYLPAIQRKRSVTVQLPDLTNKVKQLREVANLAQKRELTPAVPPGGGQEPPSDPVVPKPVDVSPFGDRSIAESIVESAVPVEFLTFAGSITKDESLKKLIDGVQEKVTDLRNARRAAYIRLGTYIVDLQEMRLSGLQENQRHVVALTSILDAEVKRWELVREQAFRFEKSFTGNYANTKTMTTIRSQAIKSHKAQLDSDPAHDFNDTEAVTLRNSITLINSYLAIDAINDRLGLENQLDLNIEVKLHESTLQTLGMRAKEADIRYVLQEQSDLMGTGLTAEDIFDVLQTGLLGVIAGKE